MHVESFWGHADISVDIRQQDRWNCAEEEADPQCCDNSFHRNYVMDMALNSCPRMWQ